MFETNYTIEPLDERRLFLSFPKIQFSDIFPENVFYRGSNFQIQEIAKLDISIKEESLIDVDMNYYEPNLFLGSWQIFRFTGFELDGRGYFYPGTNEPNMQGKLTGTLPKLVRESWHTIGDGARANRATLQILLDGCNTDIRPALVRTPDSGIIQGDRFVAKENIFTGFGYEVTPPLADEFFFGQLEAIGLYISPGANLISAQYTAAVINVLDTQAGIIPAFSCGTNEVDCIGRLREALAGSTTQFATEEECLVVNPTGCLPYDFFVDSECGFLPAWEAGLGPP